MHDGVLESMVDEFKKGSNGDGKGINNIDIEEANHHPHHKSSGSLARPTRRDDSLLDEIYTAGREAGLHAIGVAPVGIFEEARLAMLERREKGLHGGMHFTYSDPERATDPSKELDTALCLVVAAMSYPHSSVRTQPFNSLNKELEAAQKSSLDTGNSWGIKNNSNGSAVPSTSVHSTENQSAPPKSSNDSPAAPSPLGRIAAHAWEDRYSTLRRALGSIASLLQEHGWHAVILADSNSLVDREAAWLAGLGWYGKNSLFFVEGLGSWVLLGSVLTDAPLRPVRQRWTTYTGKLQGSTRATELPKQRSKCGGCDKCIKACPTSAIIAPGVIDARRCLAWRLQAPGSLPEELRESIGERIYGCDTCQEICPVNQRIDKKELDTKGSLLNEKPNLPDGYREMSIERRKNEQRKESGSSGGDGNGSDGNESTGLIDLLWLIEADKEELLERLGHLYIPHRKVRYLRRNALVALGNYTGPLKERAWEVLSRVMANNDEMLREHALWAWEKLRQQ